MHESRLVQLAVDGDRSAFAELAKRYRGMLYTAAYSVLRSADEAEDVAQEAICRMYTGLRSFRADSSFGHWAYTIARNTAIGRLRSLSREAPMDDLPDQESDAPSEFSVAVRHAVGRLPDRLREPVLLHYMDGYSTGEVADFLGIPPGTIRAQLTEARKVLRKELIAVLKHAVQEFVPPAELNELLVRLQAFPKVQPEVTIAEVDSPPPDPDYLEGHWGFTPLRLGGEVVVGFYDYPERELTGVSFGRVLGETEIAGRKCFEVVEADLPVQDPTSYHMSYWSAAEDELALLAVMKSEENRLMHSTDPGWDWGEHAYPRYPGRCPRVKRVPDEQFEGLDQTAMSPVGAYDVSVAGGTWRCLRVIHQESGALVEAYVNEEGRTVLWRRYNAAPEWSLDRVKGSYPKGSVEHLKAAGSHIVVYNGIEYVHWYDCMTDIVLG